MCFSILKLMCLYCLAVLIVLAPSEAPSNVTGYAVDSTTISLLWNTIAPENINGILRHYLVSILENNTGGMMEYIANSTNITISNLHSHYIYLCNVAAVTNMIGPSSQNIRINTPQDGELDLSND